MFISNTSTLSSIFSSPGIELRGLWGQSDNLGWTCCGTLRTDVTAPVNYDCFTEKQFASLCLCLAPSVTLTGVPAVPPVTPTLGPSLLLWLTHFVSSTPSASYSPFSTSKLHTEARSALFPWDRGLVSLLIHSRESLKSTHQASAFPPLFWHVLLIFISRPRLQVSGSPSVRPGFIFWFQGLGSEIHKIISKNNRNRFLLHTWMVSKLILFFDTITHVTGITF